MLGAAQTLDPSIKIPKLNVSVASKINTKFEKFIGIQGGIVQALNMVHKKWEGFGYDKEGAERLVFTLKDPKDSCLVQNGSIRVLVHGKPKLSSSTGNKYVEIKGSFTDRDCNIIDSDGRAIAQVINHMYCTTS